MSVPSVISKRYNDSADRKLRVKFMSVPSVIFKRWFDFQISLINQQQCDRVVLWTETLQGFYALQVRPDGNSVSFFLGSLCRPWLRTRSKSLEFRTSLWEAGIAQWLVELVIKRSRVGIPAGAAGEISSPGSTFCTDSYFRIHSTPVLPQ